MIVEKLLCARHCGLNARVIEAGLSMVLPHYFENF